MTPIDSESKRKPYNHLAGYVASLRSGKDKGWVVIYEAATQGFDTGGDRYAVVCETHDTICPAPNIRMARAIMKSPGFCETCFPPIPEAYPLTPERLAERDNINDMVALLCN